MSFEKNGISVLKTKAAYGWSDLVQKQREITCPGLSA
jgi:hypothetical protein